MADTDWLDSGGCFHYIDPNDISLHCKHWGSVIREWRLRSICLCSCNVGPMAVLRRRRRGSKTILKSGVKRAVRSRARCLALYRILHFKGYGLRSINTIMYKCNTNEKTSCSRYCLSICSGNLRLKHIWRNWTTFLRI